MAYATSYPHAVRPGATRRFTDWAFGLRARYVTYRAQREVYLRTLRELRSYRPHELDDLRVHTGDFEALARKQAGW